MSDFKIVKIVDPTAIVTGGLVPKGAYNAATAYAIGDSVSYNGSSYVAIIATTGNIPTDTTKWQLIAAQGATGPAGGGGGGVTDHTLLTNIGTNTHAQIDTHLASASNPHAVTKAQVGLGNVDNTSDANKPVSTAQQTALDGKVAKAGDTMTGDLTLDGSASQRDLTLTSSSAGGIKNAADTFPIYDSTSRINLETYQPHFGSYGESIRINLKDPRAKGMITYQGNWTTPHYTGSDYTWLASNPANPVTLAWIGAHFLNNDDPTDFAANLEHGHFNIEVPDAAGSLRTRFEVKLIDEDTGKFGVETTSIRTNKANFEFQIASGDEKFRLVGSDLRNKDIEFVETKRGVNPTFILRGGAVTSGDFELIRRYGTGRASAATPLKIERLTGLITLGTGTSGTAAQIVSADGTTTSPIFLVETANSGRRALQFKVTGDTANRFNMFADGKMEFGSGTAARDTNLYRSAADTLKTDDSFVVGASLTTAYTITALALTLSAAHQTVEVTAGVGITLPTAASIAGRTYDIINTHTAAITVTADGTEKIGNTTAAASTLSVAAGDSYTLVSNGTNWRIK